MLQRDTCSPSISTSSLSSTSAPPASLPPPNAQDEKNLVAATLLALETEDLTPLIKEELKYTIQTRRVSEGKRELQVAFKQPQAYKLTDEEVERVDRRREQRLAAQKFRRKQKAEADVHIKRIQRLKSSNTKLKEELRSLREEKSQLFYLWSSHMSVCPARIETGGPDTPGFILGQGTPGFISAYQGLRYSTLRSSTFLFCFRRLGMDDAEQYVLRKHHTELLETLDTKFLIPFLFENGIVRKENYLDNVVCRPERVKKMLLFLKDCCSFEMFLECLRHDENYTFIADTLEKELSNLDGQHDILDNPNNILLCCYYFLPCVP